jgi:hypothetical protein
MNSKGYSSPPNYFFRKQKKSKRDEYICVLHLGGAASLSLSLSLSLYVSIFIYVT